MDTIEIFLDGRPAGKLTAEREGLYIHFQASCRQEGGKPLRLVAVGTAGELRLGIPEPERSGRFVLERKIPAKESAAAGTLLRAELRPCGQIVDDGSGWQAVTAPERLFRNAFLKEQLRGIQGILARSDGAVRKIAIPFDRRRPFLMTSLFCFAQVRRIAGKDYAVFCFDREDNPVFR